MKEPGLDGRHLEDSIISHVKACRIVLDQMRCPGGKDVGTECFSDAQLKTLRDLYSTSPLPYTLSGTRELPGYALGADWENFLSSDTKPASSEDAPYARVPESFVRYFLLRDANATETLAFDPLKPEKPLTRILEVARLLDRTSTDLDRFIARGAS